MKTLKSLLSLSFRTGEARARYGISLLLAILLLTLTACKKNDEAGCQGVDCLPPATQTGEDTFGCLVNGEPFLDNSGFFNCFYQLVDGEYYFGITAQDSGNEYIQIDIGSLNSSIEIETELELNEREDGNFYALLSFDCICPQGMTNSNTPGTLEITKLDLTNNIVSGIFNFTVTNPDTGETYEITEGRFDSFFTQ